jgi:hypothetical protein
VTYSAHRLKVGGGLVLEIIGVGDLFGSPRALIIRVVNVGSSPFALVGWVLLHGRLPLAAARCLFALGVGNLGGNPVTVLFVIPVLWLLSFRVGNGSWFIVEPVVGLGGFLVNDLIGLILIPVFRLGGFWVWDASELNPVFGLLVLRVVNFLVGVDCRSEIFKEGAVLGGFIVDQKLE